MPPLIATRISPDNLLAILARHQGASSTMAVADCALQAEKEHERFAAVNNHVFRRLAVSRNRALIQALICSDKRSRAKPSIWPTGYGLTTYSSVSCPTEELLPMFCITLNFPRHWKQIFRRMYLKFVENSTQNSEP